MRRACLRGDLVRLTAGRYLRREHWRLFGPAARHVMLCFAAVSRLETPVMVSHASAAAFWGLPRLGPWPARAHVIDTAVRMATAGRYVQRHTGPLPDDDIARRNGILVTSAARTVLDLAVTAPFRQSVVALDHAYRLGLASPDDLLRRNESRGVQRGSVRAARAIGFADARADRPGESLSRVVIAEAGLAAPELQHTFRSQDGARAVVDFFWPKEGIVGEFDGETKYRDSERWSGLPPEEVVVREKHREDWLRACPRSAGSSAGHGATP